MLVELDELALVDDWGAGPTIQHQPAGATTAITAPYDTAQKIGTVRLATAAEIDEMIGRAAAFQPEWDGLGGHVRAVLLEAVADSYEEIGRAHV